MKKFFAGMALLGGMALAAADPFFEATVKHVDMGGEMFAYQNLTESMKSFEGIITSLENATRRPLVKSAVKAFAKTLDLGSFKGIAQSSVKVAPRLYVHKSFVLTEGNSRSILAGKAARNVRLDMIMRSLPADTRLAVYADVDSAFIWARITEEIIASGDQKLIQLVNETKANFKTMGIDVDALAASVNGPMMLVVTGKSPLELKFAVLIADKDGVLGAVLRKHFPPKAGENFYPIRKSQYLPQARLIYSERGILFVSDPKLLDPPAKMFGDTPRFRRFASLVPTEGSGFMIVDISKNFAKTFNAFIPNDYKPFQLRPFSMVTVESASSDGVGSVTVSNFSLPSVSPKIMAATFQKALSEAGKKVSGIKGKVIQTAPAQKPAAPAQKPAK